MATVTAKPAATPAPAPAVDPTAPWSIFGNAQNKTAAGKASAVTWAKDLLQAIGAPVTKANEQFIYSWEYAEGGGGLNNPLNNGPLTPAEEKQWGLPFQDVTSLTGSQFGGGAAAYGSWSDGVKAAADYLNMSNYAGILNALKANNPTAANQALIASPWAGGHYGGVPISTQTPPSYAGPTGSPYVTQHWAGILDLVGNKFTELTVAERQTLLHWLASGEYPQGGDALIAKLSPSHKSLWDSWVSSSQGDIGQAIPQGPTGGALTGGLSAVGGGILSTGEFLGNVWGDLTSAQFWIRVGFIILGFSLLVIGVKSLTNSVEGPSGSGPNSLGSSTKRAMETP